MEQRILEVITGAIGTSIQSALTGYNGPLNKLCEEVVTKHRPDLFNIIDGEVCALKDSPEFRLAVKDAMTHKLARVLVSKMEGEIEKQVSELRARPEIRAQIIIAVKNIIDGAQP